MIGQLYTVPAHALCCVTCQRFPVNWFQALLVAEAPLLYVAPSHRYTVICILC